MSNWISVDKEMPPKAFSGLSDFTSRVLVSVGAYRLIAAFYYSEGVWYDDNNDIVEDVEYWMPLPPPHV